MKQGGSFYYRADAKRTVRFIQVLVAPILSLYATLVAVGILPNGYQASPIISYSIALLWLVLCVYYYLVESRSKIDEIFRHIAIQSLALGLFVFTTGFTQPLVVLFGLLIVCSYVTFGRIGFMVSAAAFVLAAAVSLSVIPVVTYAIVAQTSIATISVLLLTAAIIAVMSAQETQRIAYLHSQERGRLQYDRMTTIMNNLNDATFSTDEKGAVLMYNAACLDLLDTNDSLRGKRIGDLFVLKTVEGEAVDFLSILKAAARTTRRDDLNLVFEDGETIRLELTFSPIRSSYNVAKKAQEQGGYIIIARDVTKQKSLEEQRDEFISIVSHELRTPITIVEGTLSNLALMMNSPTHSDPALLASTVTTAHDQVIYLANMVNDLSTLSRAERGLADAPELIDITELLHALHQQYEAEALKKKLHLNLQLGPRLGAVNVSRLYLEELLQNFITNGIKYTKEGAVTIIAKRTKNVVTFAVTDTGMGISRSDQQKVFHKFYRSEDYRIRESSGTGLGLYVSTQLAHKLQTHIQLKSRLNHGSTFSFDLPVAK